MTYTEVTIECAPEDIDSVCDRLTAMGCGGFVIEKPELLGRGDAQAAHGRKPRLFAREHRQRLRADGQKRRVFAAFLCLFAAEVI